MERHNKSNTHCSQSLSHPVFVLWWTTVPHYTHNPIRGCVLLSCLFLIHTFLLCVCACVIVCVSVNYDDTITSSNESPSTFPSSSTSRDYQEWRLVVGCTSNQCLSCSFVRSNVWQDQINTEPTKPKTTAKPTSIHDGGLVFHSFSYNQPTIGSKKRQ